MQLTQLQNGCWKNVGQDSNATQKIRNLALEYYIEYRQHLKQQKSFIQTEQKIQNLFMISYFISQKSEVVYNLKGQKISNVAFSINQLAKRHTDYKQFFFHLKQMMRTVTLPVQAVGAYEEINLLTKYFSFVMTYYNKFLSTFEKILINHTIPKSEIQMLGGETGYKDKIKFLIWLLFIDYRQKVLRNSLETIENTCLLACIFSYFIYKQYKQDKIVSIYSADIIEEGGTFSNDQQEIQETMLRYFCLKDIKTYLQIKKKFRQYIKKIPSKLDISKIFSYKKVSDNVQIISNIYQKGLDSNQNKQIDERLFLNNLVNNQSNLRFTPFGAKKKFSKFQNIHQTYSKRVLDFQKQIGSLPEMTNDRTIQKEVNFDILHKFRVSNTPVPLIQSTPITQITQAYNWLFAKTEKHAIALQQQEGLDIQSLLDIGYRSDQFQPDNDKILQKRKLIEALFYDLLQILDQQNQQSVNICTIISLEIFYYVQSITNRNFVQIVKFLGLSWFEIWKTLEKVLNYDRKMPYGIKNHLLQIQTNIVSEHIWKQERFVERFIENSAQSQEMTLFYNRIVHHIAYLVSQLCKNLQISQKIIDQSFIVAQYFLRETQYDLININLDVIVICSIFGVSRVQGHQLKLMGILNMYKKINHLDSKSIQKLENFEGKNQKWLNIITFYNEIFLNQTKPLLYKIKSKTQISSITNSGRLILSPVSQIVPSQIMNMRTPKKTAQWNSPMLKAYQQSPLLRKNIFSNISNLNDNYKFEKTKQKEYQQSQILKDRSNISEMIQKKFGHKQTGSTITKNHYGIK